MRKVVGWAAASLAVMVVAAGCSDGGSASPPQQQSSGSTPQVAPTARPATPPDAGLRPVKNAYKDGIGFVLPETSAQLLCQALSPQEWREAVGGDVGRQVSSAPHKGTCQIASGGLRLTLHMATMDINAGGGRTERIADRLVKFETHDSNALATAAAIPLGEEDHRAQQRLSAAPVLFAEAFMTSREKNPDLNGIVRRVLTALLPRLAGDGPATPVANSSDKLPYVPTEPVPGVQLLDLPQSVQSRILCTVAAKTMNRKPDAETMSANAVGECQISGSDSAFLQVDPFGHQVDRKATIAGRPAGYGNRSIVIELLTVKDERGESMYVNLELSRSDLEGDQEMAWAEKVAASLLKN